MQTSNNCAASVPGAVRWAVSSVCHRDPVPSVGAQKEGWEGGFH